jgi:putative endonuclease
MYYVYLIQCEDGSFYTGITANVERRFKEHQTKSGGWYTKLHKVIKLLYTEQYPTKHEALKREKQIKGWRREKKLNLIKFGKPVI